MRTKLHILCLLHLDFQINREKVLVNHAAEILYNQNLQSDSILSHYSCFLKFGQMKRM